MIRYRLFIVSLFVVAALPLGAQDVEVPNETGDSAPVAGFIFNAPNLLLDIDSYQGGFGGKLRFSDFALRALVSTGYQSTNSRLETGIGITYEQPFFPGRVTPFWGAVAGLAFSSERFEVDAENYTETRAVTGTAGVVLGAEVLLFDFMSVFAEYELGGSLVQTTVSESVDGTVTDASSTNYAFGIGLGNSAAIGIVVYLEPLGVLEDSGQTE